MKRFMLVAAVVAMAASGCVNTSQFMRSKSDSTNSFSQSRTRKSGVQNVSYNAPVKADSNVKPVSGMFYGLTPNHLDSCCCGDCCETTCGCPDECCEAECGCPEPCCDECCESTCGCPDECCDTCCEASCGCDDGGGGGFFGGGLLGNRRKNKRCNSSQCYDCYNGGGYDGGQCYDCNGGCNGGNGGCGPRLGQRFVGCMASGGCCPHSGGYPEYYNFTPGPQGGQVAYPYYTTRGPRDFLMCNPQPLGPY